jgi:hypothetical protein
MSPAFVPSVKETVRRATLEMARKIARRVLSMKTMGQIRGYLTRRTHQLCPDVAFLDVQK